MSAAEYTTGESVANGGARVIFDIISLPPPAGVRPVGLAPPPLRLALFQRLSFVARSAGED